MSALQALREGVIFTPHPGGIVNTLLEPSPDVVQELRAVMREQGVDAPISQWIIRQVERWDTFADRLRTPQFARYYEMTSANFDQATAFIDVHAGMRVLEIGANLDLHFLRWFYERGAECYASNVYFHYRDPHEEAWAHRVVADMNALPYRDGLFDIVLLSATTHHSPDLDRTVSEIARVCKPGARVLILNDQVHGLLKHAWDRFGAKFQRGHDRDADVHENEYSPRHYRRLFRKYGLSLVAQPFPASYERRLSTMDVADVRFVPIARMAARAWRSPRLRSLIATRAFRAVQPVLGLQLNVVLEKG